LEIVVIERTNSILPRALLTDQLGEKSRHRRDRQERLAKAFTARPRRNDILPRLELSDIPIADLRPSARKVRKLDPAHVREVASSISALGFCVPLLVGRDNEIINGEVSYEAAKQLGLDRLPCVRIGHLSLEEQRVLRLAVNRLAEKGEWDLDALKIEFDELIVTDAPIEITGFSPAEIDPCHSGRRR
jgi:ParB-like chromosome segregation protein Spo0J